MAEVSKDRENFNKVSKENYNDGYEYSRDEQYQDIINEIFLNVKSEEKAKSEEKPVSFDESIKRYELDEEVVHIFTDNAKEDKELKKRYAFWLLLFFILQLVTFNVVFILAGCDILRYSEKTFNIYVTSGVIEIISLIAVIVKYLFKDNITEALNNVLEKNKTDK